MEQITSKNQRVPGRKDVAVRLRFPVMEVSWEYPTNHFIYPCLGVSWIFYDKPSSYLGYPKFGKTPHRNQQLSWENPLLEIGDTALFYLFWR